MISRIKIILNDSYTKANELQTKPINHIVEMIQPHFGCTTFNHLQLIGIRLQKYHTEYLPM